MNKNAEKWVKALESDDFKQASGVLHVANLKDDHYCCLGVACKLYQDEVGDLEVGTGWHGVHYDGKGSALPTKVMTWLGLSSESGDYARGRYSLAERNDMGKNFKEIAKIIRKEPKGLFV